MVESSSANLVENILEREFKCLLLGLRPAELVFFPSSCFCVNKLVKDLPLNENELLEVSLILPLLSFTNRSCCWFGAQDKKTIQYTCAFFLYLFVSVAKLETGADSNCAREELYTGSAKILFLTVLHAFWKTLQLELTA